MSEVVNLVLRGAGVAAALLLIYMAFFLYEDEQQNMQDHLEALWIGVKRGAGSTTAGLLREVARLANRGLERVFGPRILSIQFLAVSFCFACSSACLLFPTLLGLGGRESYPLNAKDAVWFLLLALVGLLPAIFQKKWAVWTALMPLVLAIIGIVVLVIFGPHHNWDWGDVFILGGPFFSVSALALLITINRIGLKRQEHFPSLFKALILGVLNAAFVVALILPLRFWADNNFADPYVRGPVTAIAYYLLAFMAFSNLFPALVVALIFLLTVAVLAHPLYWPLIARLVYAIARHELVRKPKLLGSLGFGLLLFSVNYPPWLVAVGKIAGLR